MNDEVRTRTIASLLDSGATLANASNAAVVIAGIGSVLAHSAGARAAFFGAILLWFLECWLAVRTRIDASLFRMLTEDPESRGRRLDDLLVAWGLVKRVHERSLEQRCTAALRLWRVQVMVFAIQCCALAGGFVAVLLAGTA